MARNKFTARLTLGGPTRPATGRVNPRRSWRRNTPAEDSNRRDKEVLSNSNVGVGSKEDGAGSSSDDESVEIVAEQMQQRRNVGETSDLTFTSNIEDQPPRKDDQSSRDAESSIDDSIEKDGETSIRSKKVGSSGDKESSSSNRHDDSVKIIDEQIRRQRNMGEIVELTGGSHTRLDEQKNREDVDKKKTTKRKRKRKRVKLVYARIGSHEGAHEQLAFLLENISVDDISCDESCMEETVWVEWQNGTTEKIPKSLINFVDEGSNKQGSRYSRRRRGSQSSTRRAAAKEEKQKSTNAIRGAAVKTENCGVKSEDTDEDEYVAPPSVFASNGVKNEVGVKSEDTDNEEMAGDMEAE